MVENYVLLKEILSHADILVSYRYC